MSYLSQKTPNECLTEALRHYTSSPTDFLREDTMIGTSFLRVAAHDDDFGTNAAVSYSMSGEQPEYLRVNPLTGWVYVNQPISQVDTYCIACGQQQMIQKQFKTCDFIIQKYVCIQACSLWGRRPKASSRAAISLTWDNVVVSFLWHREK